MNKPFFTYSPQCNGRRLSAEFYVVVSLLLVFGIACCAVPMQGVKPIEQMTPQEKATYMMGIYNSQYSDYMSQMGYAFSITKERWEKVRGNVKLADEQKEILAKKRQLLTDVYPLISTYESYLVSGELPSREIEEKIIDALNQLQSY